MLAYMDRFIVGSFLSMQAVAFYTVPQDAINRLRIFPIAFMTTIFPEFSAFSGDLETRRIEELIVRSAKYIFIITGCICPLLMLFAYNILYLWLGKEFASQSTMLFQIFC